MGIPAGWIGPETWAAWAATQTEAGRLGGHQRAWVDCWKQEAVISAGTVEEGRRLLAALEEWEAAVGVKMDRVYFRQLTPNPDGGRAPVCWRGAAPTEPGFLIRENGLRFYVCPGRGYSAGLFPDQRENRRHLQQLLREKRATGQNESPRVLNLFAYTCAFSVAAAVAGALTLSVDVSARCLRWGQENFRWNNLGLAGHQWWTEDVLRVLPRLQRRGATFAAIILDPPTFARGHKGRVFRFAQAAPVLLEQAGALLEPGGWLLFSSNSREHNVSRLRELAERSVPGWRHHPGLVPEDFQTSACASTLWLQKPYNSRR